MSLATRSGFKYFEPETLSFGFPMLSGSNFDFGCDLVDCASLHEFKDLLGHPLTMCPQPLHGGTGFLSYPYDHF